MIHKYLGAVDNPLGKSAEVNIPQATLILGGAAVGAYIGYSIGGAIGMAVGAIVGSFIGALAAGAIRKMTVFLRADGGVEISYETRF